MRFSQLFGLVGENTRIRLIFSMIRSLYGTLEVANVVGFEGKKMLTTGKIAAALGVHPDTIRNYEKRGIIPVARRSPVNGYRIWAAEDLERMREILQNFGDSTDVGNESGEYPATNLVVQSNL